MQRVVLLDELGEKFGAVHEYYNLRTPADAIKLLCINYPKFQKELLESGERGVGYRVVQAGTDFELEDMLLPFGSNDLIITPVIGGSSFWKILTGAALIGLAVATGGVSLGVTGFAGTAAAVPLSSAYVATTAAIAIAGNVGIALALSGVFSNAFTST
jgi:predicted phage tail protein